MWVGYAMGKKILLSKMTRVHKMGTAQMKFRTSLNTLLISPPSHLRYCFTLVASNFVCEIFTDMQVFLALKWWPVTRQWLKTSSLAYLSSYCDASLQHPTTWAFSIGFEPICNRLCRFAIATWLSTAKLDLSHTSWTHAWWAWLPTSCNGCACFW